LARGETRQPDVERILWLGVLALVLPAPAFAAKAANACQSIAVNFLPGQETGGVSNPVLAPDSPDLGCDGNYPPVSVRLREEDTVVLDIYVLADGMVAGAGIAGTVSKPRLTDAALQIAQMKLKLIPAMQNGQPVEVERRIAVVFKVIHPVTGALFTGVPVVPSR
jgi:TonB family protein